MELGLLIRMEDGFLITQSGNSLVTDKCLHVLPLQSNLHVFVGTCNNISDSSNDQLWSLHGRCQCSAYAGMWSGLVLYNINRDLCVSYVMPYYQLVVKECGIDTVTFFALPVCTLNSFIVGEYYKQFVTSDVLA